MVAGHRLEAPMLRNCGCCGLLIEEIPTSPHPDRRKRGKPEQVTDNPVLQELGLAPNGHLSE